MRWIGIILLALVVSCKTQNHIDSKSIKVMPNILWITCEDISPTLSMYGDSTAHTPYLDALAAESVVYENVFSTVGVCAPARSSIITGMYPTVIGTMHMRTGKDIHSHGSRTYKNEYGIRDLKDKNVAQYGAVIPSEIKCFTEYLRQAGYYCTNNSKTDYQFAAPLSAWDQNNKKAHWKNTPKGKPFFSVFNIDVTHESKLWKYNNKPLTIDPMKVSVPPYLPDIPSIRKTVARHYSNVELLDQKVGLLVDELKELGLYDNTIIFFYSDHGGPLPRQKREAYDSGLHVPLMVKHVYARKKGRDNQLVSFVDLAPTVLSLAGVDIPKYMNGQVFIGKYSGKNRKYVFGSGDRFDEYTDRVRVIRTDSFLYVKNYYADLTGYKDLKYRKNVPGMNDFLNMKTNNNLNDVQQNWFDQKSSEELYDVNKDPYNIINLSDRSIYYQKLIELRTILKDHQLEYADIATVPESQMLEKMWPNGIQPVTSDPTIIKNGNNYIATCRTEGASINYLISDMVIDTLDRDDLWQLYTRPVSLRKGMTVTFVAERIGYKTSNLITKE